MSKKLSWALVLSGGGARGLAHVGFLKELESSGFPRPSLVSGTSMGAIVGGLYACGIAPAELYRFILEDFNISDYMESFAFKLDGPFGQFIQTGQVLASLATRPGVDKGQKVLELFENLTEGKNFDETVIPFRCNALDLMSGREVIFRSGSVSKAMRASMSFPVFFEPLIENGMCLVDGGLVDNLPVDIAREEGFNNILAINVNHFGPVAARELRSGPQVIYRSIECTLLFKREEEKAKADLTIDISDDSTPFSFYRKREFLRLGERAVKTNFKKLEQFFDDTTKDNPKNEIPIKIRGVEI